MKIEKNYLPIEDYGIIGNLNTTALVSKQGSIDFLSYPRFDDPTIFGRLLDNEIGGFFSIDILNSNVTYKQLYLPDTAVLLTRYLVNEGIAELTDFMPLEEVEGGFVLVRKLKVIKGQHTFKVKLSPRFVYGNEGFELKKENGNLIICNKKTGDNILRIISDVVFQYKDDCLVAEVNLKSKDEIVFVLLEEKILQENPEKRRDKA